MPVSDGTFPSLPNLAGHPHQGLGNGKGEMGNQRAMTIFAFCCNQFPILNDLLVKSEAQPSQLFVFLVYYQWLVLRPAVGLGV